MTEKIFILHWIDGRTEEIAGYDIAHAFNKYYSAGALRALDYYETKKIKIKESLK